MPALSSFLTWQSAHGHNKTLYQNASLTYGKRVISEAADELINVTWTKNIILGNAFMIYDLWFFIIALSPAEHFVMVSGGQIEQGLCSFMTYYNWFERKLLLDIHFLDIVYAQPCFRFLHDQH